ncbi:MAG TPA: D-TA family PLP-dependent enzyme [Puia sp.]|uniref:D-TA family PLP-dependent enzyme n=1 Tax=Puia sp. TaxID=2045100 RepID=UPI002CE8EEDC|nr:D-TA family PLP-dependent enzyme [Puia sp.]HVU97861.1 D-TA family PLP-dependent enzyme [Puia sp.]
MDWYRIANVETLDTPALVVFPERVKENIRAAIAMTGSADRLRPHVKTHKSPDCTRLQLAAGITRFKCATIAEAEMLAIEGAPDVLLAYQPIGPKAERFAQLIRKYPATLFSCLIDNPDAATAMAKTFAGAGLDVPVYLDINVGMDRTGIAPGDEAIQLYQLAAETKGITPVGLHAYDGHIRDADVAERTRKCDEGFAKVEALRESIGAIAGVKAARMTIVAGGSPTFPVHAKRAAIADDGARTPSAPVQCSPGTFVYWDKGYGDGFPDQPFQPAALVVSRVISKRSGTRLCLDLGHKSIAAENELSRRVFFLNGPDLKPIGQSEEHLVVETDAAAMCRVGDVFYGVPYHVCPTVALYDRAVTVEDGRVTGSWKNIARDRVLTI